MPQGLTQSSSFPKPHVPPPETETDPRTQIPQNRGPPQCTKLTLKQAPVSSSEPPSLDLRTHPPKLPPARIQTAPPTPRGLRLPSLQGQAPGGVSGPKGEHQGAPGRLRLPPPVCQVPAEVRRPPPHTPWPQHPAALLAAQTLPCSPPPGMLF